MNLSARLHPGSPAMTTRPAMAPITFDRFYFTSNRVTEFNMTRAVKGMDENNVMINMLSTTSEFELEAALVKLDRLIIVACDVY